MTRRIEVGLLDLGWIQKFEEEVRTAGRALEAVADLASKACVTAGMLRVLQDDPHVTAGTTGTLTIELRVDVPTGEVRETEEGTQERVCSHRLSITECRVSAVTMIRMLHALGVQLFGEVRSLEEDSTRLQEVLGAVSDFREALRSRIVIDEADGVVVEKAKEEKAN